MKFGLVTLYDWAFWAWFGAAGYIVMSCDWICCLLCHLHPNNKYMYHFLSEGLYIVLPCIHIHLNLGMCNSCYWTVCWCMLSYTCYWTVWIMYNVISCKSVCSLCFVVLFFSNTYRNWKWNYQIRSCFASSFAAWKQCTVNLWRNWILSSYHISLGNWAIWHSCLCFPLGVLTSKTRWHGGQSRMHIFLVVQ